MAARAIKRAMIKIQILAAVEAGAGVRPAKEGVDAPEVADLAVEVVEVAGERTHREELRQQLALNPLQSLFSRMGLASRWLRD